MFWRNKKLTSEEYADLSSKIVRLSSDVQILNHTVEKMEIRLKTFHSKLARSKLDEDEEEQQDPTDLQELQRRLLGFGERKD